MESKSGKSDGTSLRTLDFVIPSSFVNRASSFASALSPDLVGLQSAGFPTGKRRKFVLAAFLRCQALLRNCFHERFPSLKVTRMHSLDFFRRNLKPIMAALTLMAMITFVFDDSMRAGSSFLVPVLFALLLGGSGFVWGTRSGKQNEYLAMGGVVGLVLGLVITTFGQRETEENFQVAGLSHRDISNLKSRRQSANQIVSLLYQKSHPIPKELLDRGPFMVQFFQMQMQQALERLQFGFNRGDLDQDVVFTHLLRQEARRLGISVNDDAVTDYIKMVTERKLSTQDFREIRQDLRVSDHFIYDVLRDELEARIAAEMTFPRSVSTPEQRWQDYRKVAVLNQIEATTIPVDAFVKSIPAPTDSELKAFFQEHAEKYPGLKGEPGFRQPDKVRLAYLVADYETIEGKVTPPTDDEIAAYYDLNKDLRFRDTKPVSEDKKDEDKKDNDADKKDAEVEKKEGEKKDSQEKGKEGDKPAEDKSQKPADKASESQDGDKPKAESQEKTTPKKEEADKKPDAEKSNSQNESDDEEDQDSNTPDAASKKDNAKADNTKAAPAEKKADEPKANEKKESSPATKKSEDKKSEDKTPASEPKLKSEPDDSKTDKPAEPKPDSEKADGDKPDAKSEDATKKPEPRYKPLEDVQDEIRDELLRERTLEEMKKRIEAVVGEMRRLGSYTIAPKDDPKHKTADEVASELKTLAQKHGLTYAETPLMSANELFKSEEHKIGSASDALDDPANRRGAASILSRIFGGGNDSTYTPEEAHDTGTQNRYAYWVIERLAAHVPTFDEKGVREQVLNAWKTTKAQPKAEERAKAIVKLAADSKKPLPEVLGGETVNGEKEAATLTVIEPPEFTHFKLQGATAPQLNPLTLSSQPVELSSIAGLEKVDDDVLTAIDGLAVGETKVIPNADRSGYFVIRLKSRTDIDAEADAPQRKDFLEKWPFAVAADQLAGNTSVPLRRGWVEEIERRYNVTWPVK